MSWFSLRNVETCCMEWIFVIRCICPASESCFTSFNSWCWLFQPPLCQGLRYVTHLPPDSLLWGSHSKSEALRRTRTQVGFLPAQRPPCGQEQQAGPRTVAPRTGCQQMRLLTKPAGSWLWHVSWNTALPWWPASLTFPWPAWHPFIASAPASVSLMTATQ